MKTKTSTQQVKSQCNGTGKSAASKNGVKANGVAKPKSERQKKKEHLAKANEALFQAWELISRRNNGSESHADAKSDL